MNRIIIVFLFCANIIVMCEMSRAQGETAIPFLLISSSPGGNGMGNITGSTITDDPMSTLANPGQLGVMSMDHYFTGGLYPSSTKWFAQLPNSDATYNVMAFNAGLDLNRFMIIPFKLSVGVGYSHISNDLGTFFVTGNDPTVLGTFRAEEHTNNISVGIGIDYYIKLGLGYTAKSVESNLAPFDVQNQGRQGVANVSTYDLGLVAQIPVIGIVDQLTGSPFKIFQTAEPVLDISFGYVRANLGDQRVVYIDAAQADPLPRNATLGLSYKAGLRLNGAISTWEIFSATLAHEVDDILVQRTPRVVDSLGYTISEPSAQYVDGSGAIKFIDNVVLGEGSTHATMRKGWELNFGEVLAIRGGSVRGKGVSYTTSGFGVRIGGIFKMLDVVSTSFSSAPVAKLILQHLDLRYDHASSTYDNLFSLNDGLTYNGLSLVVK